MTSDQATVGAFAVAALGLLGASARWLIPRAARFFRALDRMFETINGRPAQIDKAGREESPAVPSLSVQLSDLRQAIADKSNLDRRVTVLEEWRSRVEGGQQIERIVGKVESAQAWKAIEAVAKDDPPTAS